MSILKHKIDSRAVSTAPANRDKVLGVEIPEPQRLSGFGLALITLSSDKEHHVVQLVTFDIDWTILWHSEALSVHLKGLWRLECAISPIPRWCTHHDAPHRCLDPPANTKNPGNAASTPSQSLRLNT